MADTRAGAFGVPAPADGGVLNGSWGRSHVDLRKVGVKPGDRIRVEFAFGMDGCTGIEGWHVDDVRVRACNTKKAARGD